MKKIFRYLKLTCLFLSLFPFKNVYCGDCFYLETGTSLIVLTTADSAKQVAAGTPSEQAPMTPGFKLLIASLVLVNILLLVRVFMKYRRLKRNKTIMDHFNR